MKNFLERMYERSRNLNDALFSDSIKKHGPFESILDVGCWDGKGTMEYVKGSGMKRLYGIELVEEMGEEARNRGIERFSLKADQERWPFADGSIDCVISNQVVEHLSDLDHFFGEASRVLKKGGILVTSTNNLGSWHNVFSLFFRVDAV